MNTDTTNTLDTTTIATTIARDLQDAWNAGNGVAFGSVFTADADFIDIRGSHHHGRDAIGHGHQAIFDSIYKGSTVAYTVVSADAVDVDTVFAIVAATLDAPAGPLQGVHRSTLSLVVVRDDRVHGWCVRAFHNTLVVE